GAYAPQAILVASVYTPGKPLGRELSRDLRAAQRNAGHDSMRDRLATRLAGQCKNADVEPCLVEARLLFPQQIASDALVVQVDASRQHASRELRASRLARRLTADVVEQIP